MQEPKIIYVSERTLEDPQLKRRMIESPFYRGKIVINKTGSGPGNGHALWISPDGSRMCYLTKTQVEQLRMLGISEMKRPTNYEINHFIELLRKISPHDDLLEYIAQKSGVEIDIANMKAPDSNEYISGSEHYHPKPIPKDGITTKMNNCIFTKTCTNPKGIATYVFTIPFDDFQKVLVEIHINTNIRHIVHFQIMIGNDCAVLHKDHAVPYVRTDFEAIEFDLDMDKEDVRNLENQLRWNLFYIKKHPTAKKYVPHSLQVWREESGLFDYFCIMV